jgi:hypothetical protein
MCRTADNILFRTSAFGTSMHDRDRTAQKILNSADARRARWIRITIRAKICAFFFSSDIQESRSAPKLRAPFGAEERDVGSPSAQFAYDFLISCSARSSVEVSEDLSQNLGRQIPAARLGGSHR